MTGARALRLDLEAVWRPLPHRPPSPPVGGVDASGSLDPPRTARPSPGGHPRYADAGGRPGPRSRWASLLVLLLAGCAPTVIWSGHDPRRELNAQVFAADGRQWLRAAGAKDSRFDLIATDEVVFSPEGSRLAYPALLDGRWWMVVGADRLGPWEDAAEPRFSLDGRRFAFLAKTPNGWHAVVDGVMGPSFEVIQPRTLQFSADGAHVAFVGWNGACAAAVVDGAVGPCRERIRGLRVTNQGTVAAVVRESPGERFCLGNRTGPVVDAIGEWEISPDGTRSVYVARTGERWAAVVDGVPSSDCDRIQDLRLGNSGRRVAWTCSDAGRASVVVDGVAGPSALVVSAAVLAARAPDHAHIARDEDGVWVVSGNARQGPFAEVQDLLLAPGGGPPFFVARRDGRTHLVHGAQEVALRAAVAASLVVSDDGEHWAVVEGDPAARALWLVIDGRRLRRVGPDEVFGESRQQLAAWLGRELREALSPPRPLGGV